MADRVSDDMAPFRAAILSVFAAFSDAAFTFLPPGWHSRAIEARPKAGRAAIFKFPRHEEAATALRREAALLRHVRPVVSLPVPDLALHETALAEVTSVTGGTGLFSSHHALVGRHLISTEYEQLEESARDRLASDMAHFYAALHALDKNMMQKAGAGHVDPWPSADELRSDIQTHLPASLHDWACQQVAAWESLPSDPLGEVYGFFDGHGWNMAFDHEAGRLNGIYDFADSGIGALHLEFTYTNWISRDLTLRIIAEYERLTSRHLDRNRIDLLTTIYRLAELGSTEEQPEDLPKNIPTPVTNLLTWKRVLEG